MENWETILTFMYPNEAHMAQGFLESEGIESFLKDEMTVQVQNFYSNAIGGVKLQVRDGDVEKAKAILESGGYSGMEKLRIIEKVVLEKITNTKECPFCHSENIGKNKNVDVLTIGVFLVLGAIFPIFKLSKTCFDCGKEWKFVVK